MVRAVIQRVKSASVTVDDQTISKINRGILALIGIQTTDTRAELEWLATKLLNLKLFPQSDGNGGAEDAWGWKKSVFDAGAEVLCVSQFTLYANCKKGSKPDFHAAMPGDKSKTMYDEFLADLRRKYTADKVFDGRFGAMMDVALVNDGPVTIILDSAVDAPKANGQQQDKNAEKARRRLEAERLAAEKQKKREQAALEQAEKRKQTTTDTSAETAQDASLAERFKEAMTESY
ncbi:hypothetical protein ACM66B_000968 [Microbotryomycetes sp. NB124-2]